jgi:hypothetical protein
VGMPAPSRPKSRLRMDGAGYTVPAVYYRSAELLFSP